MLPKTVLIALIGFFSCKLEPNTPTAKPKNFDKHAYAANLQQERDSIRLSAVANHKAKIEPSQTRKSPIVENKKSNSIPTATDTVHLEILYGKAKIDTVKVPQHKMVFVFDSDTANKLHLKLSSIDSTAQIQFTQIINPLGKQEVLVGKDTVYLVQDKGLHKVIISDNSPSETPYSGRFLFEVKLGW